MIEKVPRLCRGQDRSNFRWRISQTIKGPAVLVDPVAGVDLVALADVDPAALADGVALVVPAVVVVVVLVDAIIGARAMGCTKT